MEITRGWQTILLESMNRDKRIAKKAHILPIRSDASIICFVRNIFEAYVVLRTETGREIRNRCVTRPTEHQRILIDKLGFRLPTRIREGKM